MTGPKSYENFLDHRGWIGHKRPEDGTLEFGDGLNRLALMKICYPFHRPFPEFETAINQSTVIDVHGNVEPTRHWDMTKWYGQPGTMSRDNFWPWIICLGLQNEIQWVRFYLILLLCRLGFFWNTKKIWETDGWKVPDWGGPYFWSSGLRAAKVWWFPIWWITDFLMILNSVIRVVMGYAWRSHTSDDIVHQCVLWQFLRLKWYWQTPMGYLAWIIYWLRPPAYTKEAIENKQFWGSSYKPIPMSPFQQYFYGPNKPPIDQHWQPKELVLWPKLKKMPLTIRIR